MRNSLILLMLAVFAVPGFGQTFGLLRDGNFDTLALDYWWQDYGFHALDSEFLRSPRYSRHIWTPNLQISQRLYQWPTNIVGPGLFKVHVGGWCFSDTVTRFGFYIVELHKIDTLGNQITILLPSVGKYTIGNEWTTIDTVYEIRLNTGESFSISHRVPYLLAIISTHNEAWYDDWYCWGEWIPETGVEEPERVTLKQPTRRTVGCYDILGRRVSSTHIGTYFEVRSDGTIKKKLRLR